MLRDFFKWFDVNEQGHAMCRWRHYRSTENKRRQRPRHHFSRFFDSARPVDPNGHGSVAFKRDENSFKWLYKLCCFEGCFLWEISNAISPSETSKTNRHLLIFVVHAEPKSEQITKHFLQTCFPKTYFAKDWNISYLLLVDSCASSIQTHHLGPLRTLHITRWANCQGLSAGTPL